MPQLAKGGRELLDLLEADLAAATREMLDAIELLPTNRGAAQDCCSRALTRLAAARKRVQEKLPPYLEREAPKLEQRVADLERAVEQLQQRQIIQVRCDCGQSTNDE